VIEVHLDLGGYPVTLLDTAGIRESGDPVEQEGVRRAGARAAAADLVLWVTEPKSEQTSSNKVENYWLIRNKADLTDSAPNQSSDTACHSKIYTISATTGAGIDGLVAALGDHAGDVLSGREPALVTRQRHRQVLGEASEALARALGEGQAGREDIVAEELRLAARALGRLTGRVDVDDVLDVIFRDFCIGK
jgi:tRNA modification GTPase